MNFQIITDSCCNLPWSMLNEFGIKILPLTFMDPDGNQYTSYQADGDADLASFYKMMREGRVFTTSLPKLEETNKLMKKILEEGTDILYLGFSSGLSGTCQATQLLMAQLQGQFPERKLVSVDTLAASMGQGLLVYYAGKMAQAGASIEEIAQFVEDNKQKLAHWFTVEDLIYLFRGGRVSRSSAWAGNLLNIKPVLHVDDEGHLIPMEKVRGRKKSLNALVGHMEKTYTGVDALDGRGKIVMLSHGDCIDDANYVEKKILEKWPDAQVIINCIDPVIGAHAGPGTVALFFLAENKQ